MLDANFPFLDPDLSALPPRSLFVSRLSFSSCCFLVKLRVLLLRDTDETRFSELDSRPPDEFVGSLERLVELVNRRPNASDERPEVDERSEARLGVDPVT